MRTIKFRAKPCTDIHFDEIGVHASKNDFVYGNLIQDGKVAYIVNGIVEVTDEYLQLEQWIPVRPETIGQFTGLYDKNGKEIWEGDVIQYDDNKKWYGSKVWEMYGLGMSFAEINEHIAKLPPHTVNVEIPNIYEVCELNHYEVIGNVHEVKK